MRLTSFLLVLCAILFMSSSQGASLTSSSQASCFNMAPVSQHSTTASSASCSESFSFSKSVASASGTASYGTLTAAGSAGDKDITTSFQTSESFADTLHFQGSAPAGGVEVQFDIQTQGSLDEENLVGKSPTYTLSFLDGGRPLAVSETCSVACIFSYQYIFSKGYLVTVSDPTLSPISFSATLELSAIAEAGTAFGFNDSAQLTSIALLDPETGLPISSLGYSTDSGTTYGVNASFVPEPGSFILLPIGVAVLGLLCHRSSRAGTSHPLK